MHSGLLWVIPDASVRSRDVCFNFKSGRLSVGNQRLLSARSGHRTWPNRSVIKTAGVRNVYAELHACDKDFECCRISQRAPSHLDGAQCARLGLLAPFSLR